MPERYFMARLFLMTGAILATVGLILWWALPITMFPPYLVSAALALGYGAACRWGRFAGTPKS